ncbi:MAG TPA: hypothetical protein EYN51_10230 [Flavobacteriales bacterium]|nr:hypothetical protein [Flavobacteriales bacterium]HIA10662.1 hypothetical protein [Flavobacteriales bacterium]
MRFPHFLILFLIVGLNIRCHTGEKPQAANSSETKSAVPSVPRSVNACYAEATVLEILPDLNKSDPTDPCASVPCYARIRIDRVINRGMECDNSVHGGAELKVFFSCSLVQTGKALFPGMTASYPGLKKNDKFAASFLTFVRGDKDAITFKVTGYQKTK